MDPTCTYSFDNRNNSCFPKYEEQCQSSFMYARERRMERDVGDILDRWSISKLKAERIGTPDNRKEYKAFDEEVSKLIKQYKDIPLELFQKEMININATIWFLEASMKKDKEVLPNPQYLDDKKNKNILVSIGKSAVLIRNINNFRVGLKNIVNSLLGGGFLDVKSNHMSE